MSTELDMERNEKFYYLIKWIRSEKPYYQLGEMVYTGANNKYIPTPRENFYSINSAFRLIKNKLSHYTIRLLTNGLDDTEIEAVNTFIKSNYFIIDFRHLSKPIGKKADGTPYRVLLVDNDIDNLKKVMKLMLKEHFDIMSMSKSGPQALTFFEKNSKHIDCVIMEIMLPATNGYNIIEKMREIKGDIKVIVMTKTNNSFNVQRAIEVNVQGYLVKPIIKAHLIKSLNNTLH